MPAVIKTAQAKQTDLPVAPNNTELNYAEFEKQATGKLTAAQSALLKKIGECESGFQMKPNSSGASSAFGIFQILKVHDARAKRLGVSRWTREGNITLAIDIYLEQGQAPWLASKSCWGSKI